MARIGEEELGRLKQAVSLKRLVESKGVELVRQGKDWVARCPLHEGDNEPSFHLTEGQPDLFHCFGCGAGGDAISWLQKTEPGLSFRHAVELLKRLAGEPGAEVPRSLKRASAALERTADDQKLLLQVVDFYSASLKNKPEALHYLEKRGLCDAEMIQHFRVGYADRSLCYELTKGSHTKLRQGLKRIGVLRERTGHEHFNSCVVFPIFDEHGAVTDLYGRRVTPAQRGAPEHLYLRGQHRGVWNLQAIAECGGELVLCEAILDALSFWAHGIHNVTASFGAGGFTAQMLEAFKRHGVRRLYIAYDPDEAGDREAVDLARALAAEDIECLRVRFPDGLDANAFALVYTPAEQSLRRLLEQAEPMASVVLAAAAPPPAGQAPVPALQSAPEGKLASDPSGREGRERNATEEQARPDAGVEAGAALASKEEVYTPAAAAEPGAAELQAALASKEEVYTPAAAAELRAAELQAALAAREEVYTPAAAAAPGLPSLAAGAAAAPAAAPEPAEPSAPARPRGVLLRFENDQAEVWLSDRFWRISGFAKNASSLERLEVHLHCVRGEAFHRDRVELYSARARSGFVRQAAAELGVKEEVVRADLGKLLLALEELHEAHVRAELQPKVQAVKLSEQDTEEGLSLLRSPRLAERIVEDLGHWLVGERTNKLVGYLVAVSRLLARPLGLLIQSASAAGKSALIDAVAALMPEEACVRYSAMTAQSLFYMGDKDLRHKLLIVAEEKGVEKAAYPLKLLLSDGRLSIASTGKDPQSGKQVTHEYQTEGPTGLLCSSTAAETDEELQNRCLVSSVDESREQTRAIHALQRRRAGAEGIWAEEQRASLQHLHHNAQRLLRPLHVLNPWAEQLTFLDDQTRTRRDHMKYLTLIEASALLHQYQREVRTSVFGGKSKQYVVAAPADVALANVLTNELLGRSLDELGPQTRRLLDIVQPKVAEQCEREQLEQAHYRFWQKDVRRWTGWSHVQVKKHLHRLVELEYVLSHRGRRGQSTEYELLYRGEGQDGGKFVPGLLEVSKLGGGQEPQGGEAQKWDPQNGQWDPTKGEWDPPGTPQAPPRHRPGTADGNASRPRIEGPRRESKPQNARNAVQGPLSSAAGASYAQGGRNGIGALESGRNGSGAQQQANQPAGQEG